MKHQVVGFFSKGPVRFVAILLFATIVIPLLVSMTSVFAYDGGYPWIGASLTGASDTFGYNPCPSNSTGCMGNTSNGYGEDDPWLEFFRQCTSYVAWKANTAFSGSSAPMVYQWSDANNWATAAGNAGYSVYAGTSSYKPVVGDLADWTNSLDHVAYVYGFDSSGNAELDEYNVGLDGLFYYGRTTASGSAGTPSDWIHLGTLPFHISFQGSGTDLDVYNSLSGQTAAPSLGMASGTSPSTTLTSTGNYQSAFQGSTGDLYIYDSYTELTTHPPVGMASGTSPSITQLTNGSYEVAFQGASTGDLNIYNSWTASDTSLSLGMKSGTSPSIVASSNGNYYVAFQGNTGDLYVYDSSNSTTTHVGLGMYSGTSPSITRLYSGALEVAIEANSGILYTWYSSTGTGTDMMLTMKSGTSPDITTLSTGIYEIAFQGNTGDLYIYDNNSGLTTHVSLGMKSGTSPSIN